MPTPAALAPPPGSDLRPLPGDPGPPIVGYTFRYMDDPLRWGRLRYDTHGPVSWTRAFGQRIVTALGPDLAETVLVNRDKVFSQGGWDWFIEPFFPRGLMLLDFDEHLHHRRIMQQAFTRKRLRGYLQRMAPVLARGIDAWEPDGAFAVYPALKQLTLDVATDVFTGVQLGPQADRINRAFVDTVRGGTAVVRAPVPPGRWWRGLRGRARLERFFRRGLPHARASDGDTLFSALSHAEDEDGNTFSDADVVNHMIFLMMAAHDTSTIAMTTMFHELGRHPEWQERCRRESRALDEPALDHDDVAELQALDLVMRECLRLLAPVPMLPRRTVRDTELGGFFVPADTIVSVSPHFVHHMPELWPDPGRFDPGRFAPDRREDRVHSHAWIPFGGGVHKCIGLHFGRMEITAAMHQILLRWRWRVPPGYHMPVDFTALPKPADDLPVRLERID